MGLFNRFKQTFVGGGGSTTSDGNQDGESSNHESKPKKPKTRRKSLFFQLISPSDVTEGSLQVWAGLPQKIRQDPSLASFQIVNDRLHGEGHDIEGANEEIAMEESKDDDDDESGDHSEFITMKMNNDTDEIKSSDNEISSHPSPVVETHPSPHSHSSPTMHSSGNHSGSDLHHHHFDDHSPLKDDANYKHYLKSGSLMIIWIIFALILMIKQEKVIIDKSLSVPSGTTRIYPVYQKPVNERIILSIKGALRPEEFNPVLTKDYMSVHMQIVHLSNNSTDVAAANLIENVGDIWKVPIVFWDKYDSAPTYVKQRTFHLGTALEHVELTNPDIQIRLKFWTNSREEFPFNLICDTAPMNTDTGVILAALIIILVYILIIWEIVHRTFAAILVSTLAIAILAALDDRPSMKEIIQWIDVETLLLLFSMMILVAILTETGIFDYVAVYVFKVSGGKIWPLIHGLGLITLLISAFLDNVTTVLLMTPITIRLCEVMELNPVPILMSIIVHANVGGTATPIGDPPNVIITAHPYIAKHGVTFLSFTLHMTIGVIFVAIQTMVMLRINYRHVNSLRLQEPKEIKDLRRQIMVWKRAAQSISSYSKDADIVRETLMKKVKILQHSLKKKSSVGVQETMRYQATLEQLQKQYPIKNRPLLLKSVGILVFVVCLFFVQSFPEIQRISIAWCALLGTILLLIIADREDMDALMSRIEWTTLLFFAAMFIIMEALERLGLIFWIGKQTENLILSVSENYRLAVAIILILWISAITSAFVDSVPVTTMMIRVVVSLANNPVLNLPLTPLVWALAFGPSLGGNGTLVGASANVVCAGIGEQHGYKISFTEYFKFGFPMMLGSVIVTTGYLIFSHVIFTWH